MRHLILSLIIALIPNLCGAFEIEDQLVLGDADAKRQLKVISTGDVNVFGPIVNRFLATQPDVSVLYTTVSSSELMKAISQEQAPYDIAISSAMDLQTKLANDGFAYAYSSRATAALPDWAHWRAELYAFTQEPAAIILSRKAFRDLPLPQTRQDLISLLRQNPGVFDGRVGTYDLRRSGAGYLFATQDSRTSEVYWRLTEVMGSLNTKLYCCSSDMLDAVASGELAVAYNALGSYALSREDKDAFIVLLPADFTTVMLRTALIPQNAPDKKLAGSFIDYLLDTSWSQDRQTLTPLSAANAVLDQNTDRLRRIRLGTELLIFLDGFKKKRFIEAWENAILQK